MNVSYLLACWSDTFLKQMLNCVETQWERVWDKHLLLPHQVTWLNHFMISIATTAAEEGPEIWLTLI